MTSPLLLDHIIIAVTDREQAAKDYESLGFTTITGGTHPDGHTHNKLIVTADGPYLELVAPTDPEYIKVKHEDHGRHWLYVFNAGEGYAGYALLTHDLDADMERLQAQGYTVKGPYAGGRVLPDGRESRGQGMAIEGKRYPAITQDFTPRHWRAPMADDVIQHPNGVTGVAGLVALVADLEEGTNRYQAMLGVELQAGTPVEGAVTANFQLENCVITIAAPENPGSPLASELSRRGEVPYLVRLRTTHKNNDGILNTKITHEAQIQLVP